MRWKSWIDIHKGLTPLLILTLIVLFRAWDNTTAWLYLGLHGTYGVLWVLKSRIFGDKTWERRVPFLLGIGTWIGLSLFWVAPYLIVSQRLAAPAWLMGVSTFAFTLGVFLHFASDMQKHTSLALNPGHLITTGLFRRTRNPNYLGELLIYAGFSSLAMSWFPITAVLGFLAFIWVPNMLRKDKSLSRYPEFAEYRQKSKLLIPFVV